MPTLLPRRSGPATGRTAGLLPAHPQRPRPRVLLGLEVLTGVGAVAGAVNLVGDGMGLDPALLDGTPFTSWAWPGVALAVVVGLPMLVAALAEWRRAPRAPYVSLLAGVALMGWITVQVALIGYQTWLQPTFFLVGLTVTWLASPRATRMR
jgi:hypothetical protein